MQSRYLRTLTDLPASGRVVYLHVQVRRFFCEQSTCPRRIFAEQFPDLAGPRAERTKRLQDVLRRVGLALGGEGRARLSASLGLHSSPDTLLRLIRSTPLARRATPRVLGVDDWAWRRGRTYGTVLVDLERHHVVTCFLIAWPPPWRPGSKPTQETRLISRDRSGPYAEGATLGAPEAVQVADRFHLLVRRIGACVDSFQRKEGLRAEDP